MFVYGSAILKGLRSGLGLKPVDLKDHGERELWWPRLIPCRVRRCCLPPAMAIIFSTLRVIANERKKSRFAKMSTVFVVSQFRVCAYVCFLFLVRNDPKLLKIAITAGHDTEMSPCVVIPQRLLYPVRDFPAFRIRFCYDMFNNGTRRFCTEDTVLPEITELPPIVEIWFYLILWFLGWKWTIVSSTRDAIKMRLNACLIFFVLVFLGRWSRCGLIFFVLVFVRFQYQRRAWGSHS